MLTHARGQGNSADEAIKTWVTTRGFRGEMGHQESLPVPLVIDRDSIMHAREHSPLLSWSDCYGLVSPFPSQGSPLLFPLQALTPALTHKR